MKITLSIERFDPAKDSAPYQQEFELEVEPTDRLLDALLHVKRRVDGSLGFRKSCAHGVCGSDAVVVNGVERLACKTLVQDVAEDDGATITIGPLRSLPVQKDLMVDQSEFFEKYRIVHPYLVPRETVDKAEHIQTPAERHAFDDPTKCILCSACYSSCPVVADADRPFIGPAACVQASRFVFDSRDKGLLPRLEALDAENGVWPCENHLNCTKVCPRGIKVTKCINLLKRAIKKHKESGG